MTETNNAGIDPMSDDAKVTFQKSTGEYERSGLGVGHQWKPGRIALEQNAKINQYLEQAGPGSRQCWKPGMATTQGERHVTLWTWVETAKGEMVGEPLNVSWPCPPFCTEAQINV